MLGGGGGERARDKGRMREDEGCDEPRTEATAIMAGNSRDREENMELNDFKADTVVVADADAAEEDWVEAADDD